MNKMIKTIIVVCSIIIIVVLGILLGNKYKKSSPQYLDNNEKNIWEKLEEFPNNEGDYIYLGIVNNSCNNKSNCYKIANKKDEQKLNKNNFKISFKCLEDEYSICAKSKIIIDDVLEYQVFDVFEYDYDSFLILKNDNSYVIKDVGGQFGEGLLSIFDKEGNLILDVDEVITEFYLSKNDKIDYDKLYTYNPVINDNKLYYVFRSDELVSDGIDSLIEFGFIDLNNYKYTKLYTVSALTYIVP